MISVDAAGRNVYEMCDVVFAVDIIVFGTQVCIGLCTGCPMVFARTAFV